VDSSSCSYNSSGNNKRVWFAGPVGNLLAAMAAVATGSCYEQQQPQQQQPELLVLQRRLQQQLWQLWLQQTEAASESESSLESNGLMILPCKA
jgi:hypothetical protein